VVEVSHSLQTVGGQRHHDYCRVLQYMYEFARKSKNNSQNCLYGV